MGDPTFQDLEHAGWSKTPEGYDDWLAPITRQAIEPLLASLVADYAGRRFLDIATGPGHLAAAAAARGARAEGVDFAAPMAARARRNHPEVGFAVGNAAALPYPDAAFDAAACAFGLLHFADAEAAIAEACRVLVPGGRFGLTVWCGPEQGGEFFRMVFGAIQAHGTLEVGLPPAPPFFRFADPIESRRALEGAGFTAVRREVLDLIWRPAAGEDVLALLDQGTVRLRMVLDRQTPEARQAIRRALAAAVEARRKDGAIAIPFPAALVTATKG